MGEGEGIGRVSIDVAELGAPIGASVAESASRLLQQQRSTWETLRTGYDSLKRIQTRQFRFDGYQVRVQYNPGRLTSSAAKVDDRSIRERKCFLCLHNLPEPQRGIRYGERFMILCNPFPIFPEHFTIPHVDHVPQRIEGEIGTMLDLARDLSPRYTVFYNGPRCGASAPDHLHFQAGTRQFMPIEGQYARLRAECSDEVGVRGPAKVLAIDGGERRFVAIEGTTADGVGNTARNYLRVLHEITADAEEPMVNIIAWYDVSQWTVLIFPRAKHRPSFFFAEGDERLLISPAAVDLGGVSITPLEADFRKVRHDQIATMYHEVLLSKSEFAESIEKST